MINKQGAFEEGVKRAMEHFEMPYAPSAWNDLENRMNRKGASPHAWLVALISAAAFTGAAMLTVNQLDIINSTAQSGWKKGRCETSLNITTGTSANIEALAETSLVAESIMGEQGIGNYANATQQNTSGNSSSSSLAFTKNTTNVGTLNLPIDNQAGVNSNPEASNNNVVASEGKDAASNTARAGLFIGANVSSACAGTTVDFNAANGPSKGSYLWNFGDGNFSKQQNPQHKYEKPGVYDVSLSVTSMEDGQIRTKVMDDFITIQAAPEANFEWQFINDPTSEPTVKLVNTSENATGFRWKFEDGSTSQSIAPVISYNNKGKHTIALEVWNNQGCSDSRVGYITVNKDYNLEAPEKITIGKEVFMPEALKSGKQRFELTVYHGAKAIFESTNKNKGWDGKLPDGSYAQTGQQFPWIVIIKNESTNEEKYYSGLVTVNP